MKRQRVTTLPVGEMTVMNTGDPDLINKDPFWGAIFGILNAPPAPPKPPKKTHADSRVYVLGAEDFPYVKVGHSRSPVERMTALQPGCPVRLSILAECHGAQPLERVIHVVFADLRANGEWFRRSDELDRWIAHIAGKSEAQARRITEVYGRRFT